MPRIAQVKAAAMFECVLEEVGRSEADLISALESDPRLQRLAWTAASHAARSATEAKVRAFGRVVAAAVMDDAELDPAEILTSTLGQLEVIHIRALVALRTHAEDHPPREEGSGVKIDELLGVQEALAGRIATDLLRLALVYSDGMGFRTIVQKVKIAPLALDLLTYIKDDATRS